MKNSRKAGNKGFTLIELLVVIAIIAVLAVVVILTLNPAALLQEARDANRVSDMATLKSALSLYLADVNPVQLAAPGGTATTSMDCWVSMAQATGWRLTVTSNSNTATSPANSCAQFFPDASTAGFVQTSSAANQRLLEWIGLDPGKLHEYQRRRSVRAVADRSDERSYGRRGQPDQLLCLYREHDEQHIQGCHVHGKHEV